VNIYTEFALIIILNIISKNDTFLTQDLQQRQLQGHVLLLVKFMHPIGPSHLYFWPDRPNICWVPKQHV